MMEDVTFLTIHHSLHSKTYCTFYKQIFVCPQAAEYPFASVDPTQVLHIRDVVGLETCRAGEGCFHLHIGSTYGIGDQEFS